MKLKELLEKRRLAFEAMQGISAKAAAESRSMTGEEQAAFDKADAEVESLSGEIRRAERLDTLKAELDKALPTVAGQADAVGGEDRAGTKAADAEKRYAEAFDRYVREGSEGLSAEDRATLRAGWVPEGEKRAQSTSAAAGGYTIPQAFSNALEVALKTYVGVIQAGATVMPTDTGATMPYPTVNDTAQVGELLAENAQVAAQDATFSVVNFGAYKYSSKLVLVSDELLQDTAFNWDALLGRLLGERVGRILNQHFTTGTGTGQPQGVVTGAPTGVTLPTGNTTGLTYDGLIDLIHSIDPAYRSGSCAFMMRDSTVALARKLKDSQNRPLWEPSVQAGQPDRLHGYPVFVNNDMATAAANAYTIVFGDFSKYVVRQVRGFAVRRLNERYADYAQVGFIGFARYDGKLLDAGTNPLKTLRQSAT